MISNRLFALASIISCALTVVAHAQIQQQVAFIGDALTYQWGQSPQFAAQSNWLSYGVAEPPFANYIDITDVQAQLQTIINSGKKPIIHLMVGEAFADSQSPGSTHSGIFAGWAMGFEQIIRTAQAAKLKVIVGTIPYATFGDVSDMNTWIFIYCAAHGVPVVNYASALNSGTLYYTSPTTGYTGSIPSLLLTDAGWALITDMAQTSIIQVEGYKLKSGYLQDVENEELEDTPPVVNANTMSDGAIIQFSAYGQYTDGSTHIMNNADQFGHIGLWTSTNMAVVWMNPFTGLGRGLDKGTADIKFRTNSGVTFNEWGMTVFINDVCQEFTPDCVNY